MHTRQNLTVGLVLAISMVGISYGADGILPGDGLSESTAYLIEDLADFDVFADQANAATYWSDGVYTKLTCDPNLVGRIYTTAVIAPDTSTSFGFQGTSFAGILDGNGHIVNNLTIDTTGADNDYLGLFGQINGSCAEIKNLGIENVNITGGDDSNNLGGLCGRNYSGTIRNCYATGSVTGGDSFYHLSGLCGGLCGGNYSGTITNCYSGGSVTGGDDSCYLGGLCGRNYSGTISNCYATSLVTGEDSSYYHYLGGLCGSNWGGTITNCFWDMETSGQTRSDGGFGRTTSQMKQSSTYNGWGDDIWTIEQGVDYPHLAWEGAGGTVVDNIPQRSYSGSGTETVPFILNTAADLCCLTGRQEDWDKCFEVANDINLSAITNYLPPGHFTGKFNGNGFRFFNLTVNEPDSFLLGLFGCLGNGSEISNLGMVDAEITGDHFLGSLCGRNSGTITNCYATGVVTGNGALGGLCGRNYNTITNCYSSGSVIGGYDSESLGGLCGVNHDIIINCCATGLVTGDGYLGGLCGYSWEGTITNCYATGSVTGDDYLGGLCGYNYKGAITNCFWDIETGGPDNGVGTPKTTTEMQAQSTFTDANWDFDVAPVWHMPFEATGYPMLGWQKDIPGDFTGRYGVDLADFAILSNAWLSNDTPTANWNELCDLNTNGLIDPNDLKTFAEHWLCK